MNSKSGGLRPLVVRVSLPALGIVPEDHIRAWETFSPPRRLGDKKGYFLRPTFEMYAECRPTPTECHLRATLWG